MGTGSAGPVVGTDRQRDATALGLGGVFAVLVGVSLWASLVAYAARHATRWVGGSVGPLLLVSGIASVVGFGLGSAAYARYRGLHVGLSLPRRGSRATAAGVVLAPAVLTVGTALVGNALFGVSLSSVTGRWISPDASAEILLWTVVLPAAFIGVGYGLLFCGVAYERVRQLVAPEHTVAVAAALTGFFWLLPVDALGFALTVGNVVELALTLMFGVAFGAGLGVLYRRVGDDAPTEGLERRHRFALVVAAVGVGGVATELTDLPGAVGDLLWVLVLGIAVLGYGRTRSMWVPALSIAVFRVTLGVVVYAESVLGLAMP